MTELTKKHCVPCEGGVAPLNAEQVQTLIGQLHEWQVSEDHLEISRDVVFKGFYKTMAFVNAVAWIANAQMHHPDLEVGYNHCRVRFTTHAIGGLSENDFICAAKVDALLED